jgi:hypothetical protein
MPKKKKTRRIDPELVKAMAWWQSRDHVASCYCRPCEAARRVLLDNDMWQEVYRE